jgi:hypothetical protein
LVIRLAFNDRRPKNVVVLAQAPSKKRQVDIYSPQPLGETMRPLRKSAASKDPDN